MTLLRQILSLLLLGLASPLIPLAHAQDLPDIKTEPPTQTTALVGQRVVFHIDLQAKGQLSGSPRFVLPDIPGVVLMQSEDRPVLSSATIGDAVYVIERFDFLVFAKQAGPVTIPPIQVSFGSIAAFGQPLTPHTGASDPINLQISLPPGVSTGAPSGELIPIVSSAFTATQSWQPQPKGGGGATCKIGDAFRRVITLKAQDGFSMLLPPLQIGSIAGLKTYLAAAQLSDSSERGDAIATRIETVTYICVDSGRSQIPAISYRWWNTESGAWEKIVLPGLRLTVTGAGANGNSAEASRLLLPRWLATGSTMVLLLVVSLLWTWRRRRHHALTTSNEESRFNMLLAACKRSDPAAAYKAYLAWSLFADRPRKPENDVSTEIRTDLRQLQECLISKTSWQGRPLAKSLMVWHRSVRVRHAEKRRLPQLN